MLNRTLQVFTIVFIILLHPEFTLSKETPASLTAFAPMVFIENKGQIIDQDRKSRPDLDFKIAASGVTVFIGNGKMQYQWTRVGRASGTEANLTKPFSCRQPLKDATIQIYRMDIALLNSNEHAELIKLNKHTYYEKYYLPQFGPAGIRAEAYQKLVYKNVYPNIDWVLYIKGDAVAYDFVVHPGGDVSQIKVQYQGATALNINEDGSLTSRTPFGSLTEDAPYSFQEDNTKIDSRFDLNGNILGFVVGNYTGKLTIDPTLSWATYYGGPGVFDPATTVINDHLGNVYMGGWTNSTSNIATTGSHQTTFGGALTPFFAGDAFLVKMNKDGVRQWGTYYGGPADDKAYGLACDSLGFVYMAGQTNSITGIATAGSHQPHFGGDTSALRGDLFLVKFDSLGSRLWATYYGGAEYEDGGSVSSDGQMVYLAGTTLSEHGIATPGSHQETKNVAQDAFLVKFSSTGERLWGTYYGGNGTEFYKGSISNDKLGNIYLAGTTASTDGIATVGSHQETNGGWWDAFLVKFDSAGNRQWGTYYGGIGQEVLGLEGSGLAVDDSFAIYMTGSTGSDSAISTPGSFQSDKAGGEDGFLVKFNAQGERQWATYYGGQENDAGQAVAVKGTAGVFLYGNTFSLTGIASQNAYQATFGGPSSGGYGDAFITEFNSDGNRTYGSYFGGITWDYAFSCSHHDGYLYICGSTANAVGIATPGSHLDIFPAGGMAPYLARFCFAPPESSIDLSGEDTVCAWERELYTIAATDESETYIWSLPSGWVGESDSNTIEVLTGTTGGMIRVQVVRCGDTSTIREFEAYVLAPDPAVITIDGFLLGTAGTYASYQWLLNGTPISGANASTYNVLENGDYSVITINDYGCTDTSAVYTVKNYSSIVDAKTVVNHIKVYPNPAHKTLYIHSPVPVLLSLHGLDGKQLLQAGKDEKSINIGQLSPGIYILRILSPEGQLLKAEKLLKMQRP